VVPAAITNPMADRVAALRDSLSVTPGHMATINGARWNVVVGRAMTIATQSNAKRIAPHTVD
jgi:RES domain-containing protein